MAFGLTLEVKKFFFDRKAVELLINKQGVKALSRIGAFIERRARSSLRRRKRISAPGSPPSVHSNSRIATLKAISFALDPVNQSVVVGPLRLNQKHYMGPALLSGTVPAIHEFGGRMGIREKLENIAPQIAKKAKGPKRTLSPRQMQAMILRKQQKSSQQQYIPGKKWIPIGRKKPLPEQPTRVRLASYPKRPFMGPALLAEAPKFPSLFVSNAGGAAA